MITAFNDVTLLAIAIIWPVVPRDPRTYHLQLTRILR